MEILGKRFADREQAAETLLAALENITGRDLAIIGSFRGFAISAFADGFPLKKFVVLSGAAEYRVETGGDARGNLTRIENELERLPDRLNAVRLRLGNLIRQREAAGTESGKPFPYERELAEKSARLALLDLQLNLDGGGIEPEPEQTIERNANPYRWSSPRDKKRRPGYGRGER